MTSKRQFDEYSLFPVLEEERIRKLKEVYQAKSSKQACNGAVQQVTRLPRVPPRYQNLSLSCAELASRLRDLRQPQSSMSSVQSWYTLDQSSRMFLRDVVGILEELHEILLYRLVSNKFRSKISSSPSTSNEGIGVWFEDGMQSVLETVQPM
jgi:hypothetical protein